MQQEDTRLPITHKLHIIAIMDFRTRYFRLIIALDLPQALK